MANANVRVELTADASKLEGGFKRGAAATAAMERELARVERAERRLVQTQLLAGREMEASFARRKAAAAGFAATAGRAALVGGGVLAAGLALSAKAAMDWESAFAGVRKVVDGTPEQMAALERGLRDLATTMPVTAQEIAGVAEAAGSLGVARGDIEKFTATAVKLGVATNLSAQDAATGLAKLGNIMGVTTDDVDRAGAALVALGNAGASTEQDILAMALRIGGAGRQIGLSEAQVLGFANSLSGLGIEAEAGGTAISRVFLTIEDVVRSGGAKLQQFAQVSGVSATAFRDAYAKDAAGAVTTFVAGLGRIQDEGGNAAGMLDRLGLGEIRVRDTLLRASGAADKLTKSVQLGSDAWQENAALTAEANRRFETSESRIKIARNQLNDAAIDIGAKVLPAFAALAEDVGTAAEIFGDLPGPVKEGAAVIGTLAAALGVVGGAAGIALPKVVALKAALSDMGPKGQAAAAGMGRMGSVLAGPVGIGIAAGLTVATAALGAWSKKQIEARQKVDALTEAIKADSGAIGENTRANVIDQLTSDKVYEAARRLGLNLKDVTDAALGSAAAQGRVTEATKAFLIEQQAAKGNARGYAEAVNTVQGAIGGENDEIRDSLQAYRDKQAATGDAVAAAKAQAAASADTTRAQAILSQSVDNTTESMDALKKVLDELNGKTLDMREAERSWQASIDAVTEAVKTNGKTLDVNTGKGRDNAAALDDAARAAADRAKAVLDSTGDEAAFRRSLGESRQALQRMAEKFGMTKAEARKYVDAVLAIPKDVTTTVRLTGVEAAEAKIRGLSRALQNSSGLVAGITGDLARQARKPLDGTRAGGGPVRAGGRYLVGEHHAEIFVPQQDGVILPHVGARVPNAGPGSSGGSTIQIYAPTTAAGDLYRVAQAADRRERSVRGR